LLGTEDERTEPIPEEKNKVELSVAPELLGQIPIQGNIITGDALYAQRELCAQIVEGKGDYLFIVKRNQPELHEAIEYLFQEPPFGEKFAFAQQCDAHGDCTRGPHRETAAVGFLCLARIPAHRVGVAWRRERASAQDRARDGAGGER